VVGTLPASRHIPRLVVLADQSALVYGGWVSPTGPKVKTVERAVLANGRVEVERMPDLPGAGTGYALVALKDGRAMLVGGSDQKYAGTCPCQADTWLFDPKTRRWTKGPRLLEPRADASVTVLPNGDVLVAGGWTPGHGWQEGASRTTERWKPGTDKFVADSPLPAGVAMHRAMWAPGRQGKDLLVFAGMTRAWEGSGAVMDFDIASGIWRTVGAGCSASKPEKEVTAATALSGSLAYMWCSVEPLEPPLRFALRLPSYGPVRIPQGEGMSLRRSAIGFLPAAGERPALAIGGTSNEVPTGDVDAIWPDGRIEALAPLRFARSGAAVIALADGSRVVAGGTGADSKAAEWLPAAAAASKQPRVLALEFSGEDAFGQSADGKLLALRNDGTFEAITIQPGAKGEPAVRRARLAPVERRHRSGQAGKVVIKGLADGRVIVAGGEEQPYKIALLQEDSMEPAAADRYVGAGEFEGARRYEILDPAHRTWRESAPARGSGGPVAVMDDGRVIKLAGGVIESSNASGDAWRRLDSKPPGVKLDEKAHLFAVQGELFLSGAGPESPSADAPEILQWFDSAKREWVTLWQADPKSNWRENVGRIVTRTLANGKRVVIPVEGL
jgi:hypothetical protein